MILNILLLLAASFGIFWTIKTKKMFPAIITLGMTFGILLTLLLPENIKYYGIYLYMGFVALSFLYCLVVKEMKTGARIIIGQMSAPVFAYWLWVMNHWHGNELLAPIFVLLVALAGIVGKAKLKNELGFLTISNWTKRMSYIKKDQDADSAERNR